MNKKSELIKKGFFTIGILLLFYIGQGIPVPGYIVNFKLPDAEFSFEKILSLTTGGIFSSPTLFTLGMGPYMTMSILSSVILFSNKEFAKRISKETRGRMEIIGIFVLAILQSIPVAFTLKESVIPKMNFMSPFGVFLFTILCFATGTLFISWLASLNVVYGIGGPFILILPGIMRGVTGGLIANYQSILCHFDRFLVFLLFNILFIGIAIALYSAEYRFDIQRIGIDRYSKDAYISFRLLIAGSMPLMFGTTLMYFPAYIMRLLCVRNEFILSLFDVTKTKGILVYGVILYLLGILFSFVGVMPDQITKDLKESGDYIIGVNPGKDTEKYITKRVWGITAMGSLFLPLIVITPLLVGLFTNHPSITAMSNYFAMIFVFVVIFDNLQQDVNFLLHRKNYNLFDSKRRNLNDLFFDKLGIRGERFRK